MSDESRAITPRTLDDITHDIGRLVNEYVELLDANDEQRETCFIIAWSLAYESTSVQLEADDEYRGGVINMAGQSAAASRGLFHYGREMSTTFARIVKKGDDR